MSRRSLGVIVTASLALAGPALAAGQGLELQAEGVQIYACNVSPAGSEWRLKAPEASLVDSKGAEFGRHFAGPTWQAKDGSSVVGEVVAYSAAPEPNALPWLLLRAKSHSGTGALASVTFVARIRTEGGMAPATPCDAAHRNAEQRVPYKAAYVFFS